MFRSFACCWKEAVAARPTIDDISTVNSVYFDDAALSTCQANLDGLGRRNKVRIRWYDTPQPGHSFFFEIKWRDNRVTGKHRLQMRASERLSELSYDTILASLSAASLRNVNPHWCDIVSQVCWSDINASTLRPPTDPYGQRSTTTSPTLTRRGSGSFQRRSVRPTRAWWCWRARSRSAASTTFAGSCNRSVRASAAVPSTCMAVNCSD